MRHAHAEWPDYRGADFDRPLTPRGLEEAEAAASAIASADERPVRIITSPALRTRQTAGIIADALTLDAGALILVDSLYNASARTLATALKNVPGAGTHVLLIAHNPGISELARLLTGNTRRSPFRTAEWLQLTTSTAP